MSKRLKIVEINPEFRKAVEDNDGYCPCMVFKTPDTKCMCKEFRDQKEPGPCHCGRFKKVRQFSKVIAVDFDDTLFTNAWPNVGEPIWPVINKAKEEQANGAAIILWTCRIGESLDNAVEACRKVGLIPDAVNETLPEWLETWVDDPRKIGANEYWDDRAVNIKDLEEAIWLSTGVSNSTGPIFRCSACGFLHNPSESAVKLGRQKIYPAHCPGCGKRMVGAAHGKA